MNGNDSTNQRWEACARAAATTFGDLAVVTRVQPEGDALLTVAACHRDSARDAALRQVLGERYRRGELLPGRVWEAETGILLVDVDDPALAAIAPEDSRQYIRDVGIRSLMLVPLWEGGRVVGTLGVARDSGGAPYTEEQFEQLRSLAVF